ncbi:MAG: protein-glutamate O-methyltransferase CheR [Deltaproteobacteria bacterium]|nr:protein-glutamate O-methyltransferase CheR [Deltaproteobacteria bacterium]MBW2018940.1 protein-glutamate O-methyltransferase CheR [Deltaproteobacteria bacterium]MBW2073155.1 protein-glutamate O-methyltransferase CheR [Deltaproteobacteria bacterium]RLB83775.1 MAG: protein-glutamate O-methyltransferase CheR [Deltaproteobacteria bacterium]
MLSTELSDRDFRRFSDLVYKRCGINLHEGKKELVRARLGKRLRETGFKDFNAYYKFLTQKDNGHELVKMLDAISTNLTSFFREEKHFDFLNQVVFPSYVAGRNGKRLQRLRFWSAGCSSGEEPYSLAISLLEYFGDSPGFDIKILGTDISTKVLAQAKGGVYPAARLERMPSSVVRKYFQRGYGRQEGYFRVKLSVRAMVEFRRLNLIEPFPFKEAFNLILCRNVMIYFDKSTQQTLANKFYDALTEEGYLFIGHSETLTGINHQFKYIRPSVYQKP